MPTAIEMADADLTRKMFIDGASIHDIAQYFADQGRPRTYLCCVWSLKKANLSLKDRIDRERAWSPDEDDLLRAAWASGSSLDVLRKRVLHSPTNIQTRIDELGLRSATAVKETPAVRFVSAYQWAASEPWGPATKPGRCEVERGYALPTPR